jgi:hypothetical protein
LAVPIGTILPRGRSFGKGTVVWHWEVIWSVSILLKIGALRVKATPAVGKK